MSQIKSAYWGQIAWLPAVHVQMEQMQKRIDDKKKEDDKAVKK